MLFKHCLKGFARTLQNLYLIVYTKLTIAYGLSTLLFI